MARQFGLKAMSVVVKPVAGQPVVVSQPASAEAVKPPRRRIASVFASRNCAVENVPAPELAPAFLELPFSPASWRGSRDRRSISLD